jgi:hypothetical protein
LLSLRHPGTWTGAKRKIPLRIKHQLSTPLAPWAQHWEPNIIKQLKGMDTLGDVLNQFALRSTPEAVNQARLAWGAGEWGLELMFRVPLPHEVLAQQKIARRCVSVLYRKNDISKYILGERDCLSFTMHDLIHAAHFFQHPDCLEGQLGFYGLLDFCLKAGHFKELEINPAFMNEFEYLISDMNAYGVHLLKCFKSALVHYHPAAEEFFINWLKQLDLNGLELSAWLDLNTQAYSSQQDQVLLAFLTRYKTSLNLQRP